MNIVIGDINLYYEKIGNGKKEILILPGWGDTRPTFKWMIDFFKNDYTIYIIDYPGFGKSSFPGRDLTVYDYAELIKCFLKVLGIKNPIVIAHSFGSRLSLILNGKLGVKINKLIIIDGAGVKKRKKFKLLFKQCLYKSLKKIRFILPRNLKENYIKKLINIFGSSDYKSLNENMRRTFSNIVNEDLSYLLPRVNVNTLLIWGEKDVDTPIKDGIIMNKKINDSGLVIIKDGTHFSYLEAPSYINNIIFEFIK